MNDYTIANAKERTLETLLPDPERFATVVNEFATLVRLLNDRWWRDPESGELLPQRRRNDRSTALGTFRSVGGSRKGRWTSPPTPKLVEVELADTVIRILDYAGNHRLDLGGVDYGKSFATNLSSGPHASKLAREEAEEVLKGEKMLVTSIPLWEGHKFDLPLEWELRKNADFLILRD